MHYHVTEQTSKANCKYRTFISLVERWKLPLRSYRNGYVHLRSLARHRSIERVFYIGLAKYGTKSMRLIKKMEPGLDCKKTPPYTHYIIYLITFSWETFTAEHRPPPIIGYCNLKNHLHKIGATDSGLWRFCQQK